MKDSLNDYNKHDNEKIKCSNQQSDSENKHVKNCTCSQLYENMKYSVYKKKG